MGNGARLCCKAADCGSEIRLYLRAKLGSCNCTTGIAEDTDLDRMSDFDLVGGEVSPLGAGRPIAVAFRQNGRRWRDVEHTRSQDDYEKAIGQAISDSTVYNPLHRHSWRKLMPRPFHPKRDLAAQNAFNKTAFLMR
jgi:hypothetical protein